MLLASTIKVTGSMAKEQLEELSLAAMTQNERWYVEDAQRAADFSAEIGRIHFRFCKKGDTI